MQHSGPRSKLLRSARAAAVALVGSALAAGCSLQPGSISQADPAGREGGNGGDGGSGGNKAGSGGSSSGGSAGGGSGSGSSGSGGSVPNLPPGPVGSTPPPPSECKSNMPAPRGLRRLTTPQITNSIRDLLGDASLSVPPAVDDPVALGFSVDANLLVVRALDAGRIRDLAEQIGKTAATSKLDQLIPCKSTDQNCRQTFIKSFGKRVFRSPLSDDQVKAYDGLFAAEANVQDGVEAVVSAMLQSPNFLYRRELGNASGGLYKLTQHEIAASLSYLIWNTTPDDMLLAAADNNQLMTSDQINKQVDRLLASPRAADAAKTFMHGWLDLDRLKTIVKDDKVFAVSDELRADMLHETESVVSDLFTSGAPFSSLFTKNDSPINARLAALYGVSGPGGNDFQKVTFTPAQRAGGLLGHASVLTAHSTATSSSPVQRGKMVRTRLLCQDLPPPPSNLNTMLTAPQPNETTRERFKRHSQDPVCSACHKVIDPVGFGFEEYDGVGRRRTQENGKPIDASGSVSDLDGATTTFTGLGELATALSKSTEAKACLVRFYAYYAFGRASWDQDTCTYDAIGTAAAKSDHSLPGIVRGIANSLTFTTRVQD